LATFYLAEQFHHATSFFGGTVPPNWFSLSYNLNPGSHRVTAESITEFPPGLFKGQISAFFSGDFMNKKLPSSAQAPTQPSWG